MACRGDSSNGKFKYEYLERSVIVIGGGAAGFFFAIQHMGFYPSDKVIILEQGKEGLSKVRISGGGRCNVTHACFEPGDLAINYPRGRKEMLGPFHHFATGDIMSWFEEKGVPLKIEEDGRVFPVSDSSDSIIQCFLEETRKLGIEVIYRTKVTDFYKEGNKWKVLTSSDDSYLADKLFLSTGSSLYFWKILAGKGIHIIDPVPSLFTFHVSDPRIKGLQGISFPNIKITSHAGSYVSEGPLLITHWGFSGPAILKLSAFEAILFHQSQYKFDIIIDLLPDMTISSISDVIKTWDNKKIVPRNPFDIPKRYWNNLMTQLGIDTGKNWADLKNSELELIIQELKKATFNVKGKSTFKEEFVTAGGIDLKEVDFTSFELKKLPGVFAAGEILNIDAITGGFNFQAAWTGAYIAARG